MQLIEHSIAIGLQIFSFLFFGKLHKHLVDLNPMTSPSNQLLWEKKVQAELQLQHNIPKLAIHIHSYQHINAGKLLLLFLQIYQTLHKYGQHTSTPILYLENIPIQVHLYIRVCFKNKCNAFLLKLRITAPTTLKNAKVQFANAFQEVK